MLDETFYLRSTLSATEESTLYHISDYVTFKENSATIEPTDTTKGFPSSEISVLCIVITKMWINLALIISNKHFIRFMKLRSFSASRPK